MHEWCPLSGAWFFVTPWPTAHQVPLSLGFSQQVGCHFLLQGIFPTQGLNPRPPNWQVALPLSHLGSHNVWHIANAVWVTGANAMTVRGSERPEWSVCTRFRQRAREAFLSWEAIRWELEVKRISLASCKGWNETEVGARKGMGSGPRASSGHQAVKEGLSSFPEVDVSGSEGILNMWIAVFSQSLPPHSTHLIKM